MNLFGKYLPFLLLIIVLSCVEWFINPIGEFSLNDDWAYAKSVYHWNNTGQFSIGIWPAMSLWSHALLGLVFVKLFGFSLTVLRLANMALCLLTLFHVYKFFMKSNKPTVSALVCSFIVFNPYYLNLFNSFMTDLSFFNFSFLAFYYLNEFLQNRKWYLVALFFGFAVLAMLTRQLGIILFLAFTIIAFINYRQLKAKVLWISFINLFIGLLVLYFFEKYQYANSKPESAYQGLFFSHQKIELGLHSFLLLFDKAFMILKFSGALLLPVLLLNAKLFWCKIKESNKVFLAATVLVFIYYLIYMSSDHAVGNLFINLGLGIESTVDMLMVRGDDKHASNNLIFYGLLSFFSLGYILLALYLGSFKLKNNIINHFSLSKQFIIIVLIQYLVLIGIAESSFDRYCVFFMLFYAVYFMLDKIEFSSLATSFSFFSFLIIGLFSVLGTKDYFTAAHLKNTIRNDLVVINKISSREINAGLEYQLWNGNEEEMDWINWDHYNDKKFLISRTQVSNFEIHKTYTYQRYMPLKVDTFFVLKNKAIP